VERGLVERHCSAKTDISWLYPDDVLKLEILFMMDGRGVKRRRVDETTLSSHTA
jgi:hypothetical protein